MGIQNMIKVALHINRKSLFNKQGETAGHIFGGKYTLTLTLPYAKINSKQIKAKRRGFPGGPVVKNPPSNAGDAGSIPGWGTKIPHAAGQLSLCATTTEPTRHNEREKNPHATTREKPTCCRKQREARAATKSPHAATKTQCSQIK